MSYVSLAIVVTAMILIFSGAIKPRGSEQLGKIGLGVIMILLTLIYYSNFAEQ